MPKPDANLNPQWRARIAAVGKRAFENEEMLRLGFLDEDAMKRLADADVSVESYKAAIAELAALSKRLKAVDSELAAIEDVEAVIAEIRARRIERVKAEREERKAQREEEKQQRKEEWLERKRTAPTYLGRGVSSLLSFEPVDASALTALGLPVLTTFEDIAEAIDTPPERLQWLCYVRGAADSDHYTRFEIPKRSGGTRLISSPKPELRHAQQWVQSEILAKLPVHTAAMAFRPGRSIRHNAEVHAGKAIVVRMDLKDFFPSIAFERVRSHLNRLGYNSGVATVLALLVTDEPRVALEMDGKRHFVATGKRALPQGACTSPALANLIAKRLDARLTGLAESIGWVYTRYADDLVFSTDHADANSTRLLHAVERICTDEDFTVNAKKTRVMRAPHRQTVTGLLVNAGVKLTRQDMRRIRAFLHQCEVKGLPAVSEALGRNARAMATGYLAYIHMIDPEAAEQLRDRHPWI